MWLLHLLPTSLILWIVNIAMIAGLAGILISYFIRFIPFINIYRTPIQIISIIVFCSGIYWYGGYSTEMIWRDEVAKLEEQVKESEEKSRKVNTVIKKVYLDRVKVVKQDVVVIQEKIREVSNTIDRDCKVSPEAVNLLNQAARRKPVVEVEPLKKDDKQ